MKTQDIVAIIFSTISIILGTITAYKNYQFIKDRKEFEKSIRKKASKDVKIPSVRTIRYVEENEKQIVENENTCIITKVYRLPCRNQDERLS